MAASEKMDGESRGEFNLVSTPIARWPARWLALGGILLFLLAFGFTAANLQKSAKVGRLSSIPNYDDVVYLNKASEIYFTAKKEGLVPAAKMLLTRNLHAPFPVVNALLGFTLLGPDPWRAYNMLTLVVFAYLGFIVFLARGLPIILVGGLTLAALAIPFATIAALEFRPDPFWTFLLGGSAVLFLSAARPFHGWGPSIWYGVGCGAVLLTKPSTFAMSFLVLGGVWFLAAVMAFFGGRATLREIGRGLGLTFLAGLIVAGWYCVPHGREIWDYFYQNSFGTNRDVWVFQGTLWQQWMYYVRWPVLELNLGYLLYPILFVYLWGALRDIFGGEDRFVRLRGGAFLWMLTCLFAVNGAFSMKSVFLGGSFYGFLVFGSVRYGCLFLAQGLREACLQPTSRQLFASLGVMVVAAGGYVFPDVWQTTLVERKAQKSINREVLRDLSQEMQSRGEIALLVTHGNPVVWEYLQMQFRARGRSLHVLPSAFVNDLNAIVELSAKADLALVQDQNVAGSPKDTIPTEKLQPQLIAYFNSRPEWKLIGSYSDKQGKFVYLYGRKPAEL